MIPFTATIRTKLDTVSVFTIHATSHRKAMEEMYKHVSLSSTINTVSFSLKRDKQNYLTAVSQRVKATRLKNFKKVGAVSC